MHSEYSELKENSMGNSAVQKHVHPALVLRPLLLRLFALTPLASLHHLLIAPSHFRFNAFHNAKHLFRMEISFPIYTTLPEMQLGLKTKNLCM
jgi:hypothetical protein